MVARAGRKLCVSHLLPSPLMLVGLLCITVPCCSSPRLALPTASCCMLCCHLQISVQLTVRNRFFGLFLILKQCWEKSQGLAHTEALTPLSPSPIFSACLPSLPPSPFLKGERICFILVQILSFGTSWQGRRGKMETFLSWIFRKPRKENVSTL